MARDTLRVFPFNHPWSGARAGKELPAMDTLFLRVGDIFVQTQRNPWSCTLGAAYANSVGYAHQCSRWAKQLFWVPPKDHKRIPILSPEGNDRHCGELAITEG